MTPNDAIATLRRPPAPVSIATARKALAALGMTLRHLPEAGEFRVNYRHGAEATAAYESSLPDAIGTALEMLSHKARAIRSARAAGIPATVARRDVAAILNGSL